MATATPLNVPTLDSDRSVFSDLSPGRIGEWLEQLPLANPRVSAHTLVNALHGTNRCSVRRASRLEVAERARPVVEAVADGLIHQYRRSGLPLAPEQDNDARMVQHLFRELTIAFHHAVNAALPESGTRPRNRQDLLLALQRTLLAQGRGLLEAYRLHAPEPQGFWHTLHSLYRNAEAFRLQGEPIKGKADNDETALSVKQAYLRVIILALANPYHLIEGETEELYRRLGRWIHGARLTRPDDNTSLAGRFLVDLGSDFPPRYLARQQPRRVPSAEPRLLELDQLLTTVDQQIQAVDHRITHTRHGSTLSLRHQRGMYTRFRDALGGRQERTTPRRSTLAPVSLVDGLSHVHYVLSGFQAFHPEADELRWRRKIADTSRGAHGLELAADDWIQTPQGPTRHNAYFRGYDREADDVWQRANRLDMAAAEPSDAAAETVEPVTMSRKNVSEGGMALFLARDCPLQTRVGELVAYAEPEHADNPENWGLATIQWLRTRPERGLEMGIAHLAESAFAAASKAVSGPGKGSAYMRTLIAPRVNPLSGRATLVTPASVYDRGSRLALNLGELVLHVELVRVLEQGRRYDRFAYRVLTDPQAGAAQP